MIKHSFFSLHRDIKSFFDVYSSPCNAAGIENISEKKLSDELFRSDIHVEILSSAPAQFGSFVTIGETDGRPLPPFYPGQYVIIKAGLVGIRNSRAFYIASEKDGRYEIFVPFSDDSDTMFFASAGAGAEFIVTAPAGRCCYSSLRDSRKIFICTDKQGYGAGLSFKRNKSEEYEAVIYTFFGTRFDTEDENIQLAAFLREAKAVGGNLFIYGTSDFTSKLENIAVFCGFSGKNIRTENISPAPVLRYGDRKFICSVKKGGTVREIVCSSDRTIASSLEYAGIKLNMGCMAGKCGYYDIKLIKGRVITFQSDGISVELTGGESGEIYVNPCCAYPRTDINIII